jgi:hypothetical protein
MSRMKERKAQKHGTIYVVAFSATSSFISNYTQIYKFTFTSF